ncbi:MAG TPA: DUF11 domain-containing protein [Pseudomonadales bacterium]|jgi:uncharacterized repeat protein (TIGR01451 family)
MKAPYSLMKAGLLLALGMTSWQAWAVGTAAGVDINNQASISYQVGATTINGTSNTTTTRVQELLEMTLTWQDASDVAVAPNDTDQVLTFLLTNTGNGSDTYTLTADSLLGTGDFDPTLVNIYLDSNNNGIYDAGVDTLYVAGSNDPALAADGQLAIFVLNDIPSPLNDGDLGNSQLTATSNTGSGAPGTPIAGGGDAGTDAIVGTSGGTQSDIGTYVVSNVIVSIVKSATISDPFGGNDAVPGATITYRLVVTVTGTGTANNVVVGDPIPANTTYSTGTITLDTIAKTDILDADEADFNVTAANAVTVNLGNVAAGAAAQTIEFDVTID